MSKQIRSQKFRYCICCICTIWDHINTPNAIGLDKGLGYDPSIATAFGAFNVRKQPLVCSTCTRLSAGYADVIDVSEPIL